MAVGASEIWDSGPEIETFPAFRSFQRGGSAERGLNNLQFSMKTIPVSLIVAGFLAPMVSIAQPGPGPQEPPQPGGEGRHGPPHPFLEAWKNADANHDGAITKEEFDNMPRIQKLPEEKREGLFRRLDKNGDGKVDREELARMVRPPDGQGPPMQRLWELDVDKSGGISFEEFKAGRIFKKIPPEKQQAVFQRLDTDGDGVITPKDKPQPPFRRDGEKPHPRRPDGDGPDGPRMEPRQIIRQLDKDGDGAVSFEEFRAGPAVRNLTEDEQEDRFEALDKDHDQKLTPHDFPPPPPRDEPKRPEGPPPAEE
jgi:Ca2+-binding EF-hand superfamily protein